MPAPATTTSSGESGLIAAVVLLPLVALGAGAAGGIFFERRKSARGFGSLGSGPGDIPLGATATRKDGLLREADASPW